MPTANGYLRVSSDDQTTEQQRDVIEQFYSNRLRAEGFRWGEWFADEDITGGIPIARRPAGAMLVRALAPGDAVVASKLDRAFRDTEDCLSTVRMWGERGIKVHILDLPIADVSSPEG